MATSHLLLSVASRKPDLIAPKMPDGAVYRRDSGFWTIGDESSPMINHSDFKGDIGTTKMSSRETGEDIRCE